jgi:hypothetical protein
MRGEPNAVGVRTKNFPYEDEHEFFTDDAYELNCQMIWSDLAVPTEALLLGKILVVPLGGLGTGLSRLPEKAPRTFKYLKGTIEKLTKISG